MRMFRMSDSTASAIPGYWTLIATSSPALVCPAVDLADARRGGRLGIDRGEHPLGVLPPLAGDHLPHLLPADRVDVVAKRCEPRLEMGGLVGVEPGELDRGQDLAGLHGRAPHRLKLIDERVDRRHQPVAATAAPVLLASAPVDAIACPANRAARGDLPEAQGPRSAPPGRAALLPIGHRSSLAAGWATGSECRTRPAAFRGSPGRRAGRSTRGGAA